MDVGNLLHIVASRVRNGLADFDGGGVRCSQQFENPPDFTHSRIWIVGFDRDTEAKLLWRTRLAGIDRSHLSQAIIFNKIAERLDPIALGLS